jgi:NADH-quinone oxidoreductase subunit H
MYLKKFTFFSDIAFVILISLIFVILILISVAFVTLLERKKIASIQNRKGPNKVGYFGVLQPVADGVKLVLKETIFPHNSILSIFVLSPLLAFSFGFIGWALLPLTGFSFMLADLEYGFILIFILSICHVYSIILSGWASNSKYSFYGSLRSAAQLIAYDITIGFIMLTIFIATRSFNMQKVIEFQIDNGWFVFYYPVLFVIFFICALAETNRHPFDLPEAEAELVSGYNVEYSSIGFALFFLGEYASILFMSSLVVVFFLGAWDAIIVLNSYAADYVLKLAAYFIKLTAVIYAFISIRAAIPRYRYDQLMVIGWKVLLPTSFAIFILNVIIFYIAGMTINDFDSIKFIK